KSEEEPQAVPYDRAAYCKAGLSDPEMVFLRRVRLRIIVETCRDSCRSGIVTQGGIRAAINRVRFEGAKDRTVIGVAALFHHHVDHPAKRATVLGFNARSLDLDLLNELEGDVGL